MKTLTVAAGAALAAMALVPAGASASQPSTGTLRALAVRYMHDLGETDGGTTLDICKILYEPDSLQPTCTQLTQEYQPQADGLHRLLVSIPAQLAAYKKTINRIEQAPISRRDGQYALKYVPVDPAGGQNPPSWFYFDMYHGAWRTTGPEGN